MHAFYYERGYLDGHLKIQIIYKGIFRDQSINYVYIEIKISKYYYFGVGVGVILITINQDNSLSYFKLKNSKVLKFIESIFFSLCKNFSKTFSFIYV